MQRLSLQSARPLIRGHKPLAASRLSTTARSRNQAQHLPPKLPYGTENGLGEFMSESTLTEVATVYQKGLLDRLSDLTKDTPQASQSVLQNVISFAQDRSKALEFNYASQALNNSFFLDMLKPPEQSSQTQKSEENSESLYGNEKELMEYPYLKQRIDLSFGSLAGLKSTFGGAGMGMFGSGWVWLVADSTGDLAVVATYGSGTMLVRSREQKGLQPSVLGEGRTATQSGTSFHTRSNNFSRYEAFGGTSSSPVSGSNMRFPLDPNPITPSRSFSGLKAATDAIARGNVDHTGVGYDLIPLLTCSIHEHCWLRDHGVWGKKDYLTNFWSVVDWRKLGSTYERLFGAPRKYGA
ncbi:hypothetical protein FS837_011392 [Tulasnella sp. UAMH 9824]|nr:hypothetical protein FS837_011392 [Tulasnella sp. UAMH 9824]